MAGQRLNMGGASAFIDHADAVGSTTMETDPSGAVVWDVTHYPWGRVFQEQGTRQSEVAMGLDWQVNDPAIPSATREYDFRDYRWMTPDPGNAGADVGDSQSWNMYSYVGDNPTTDSDPSGLDCIHFSASPGSIIVGVESGTCSGSGGVYVNGTVDQKSLTYNGSDLAYSYAPYSGGSGTGVIGFGAPASTSDSLGALSLAGQWASTGIRDAAINMAINGALVGVGGLIDMGAEALLAEEETGWSGFASNEKLEAHFEKHGAEFGAGTPGEYAARAKGFMEGPKGPGVLEKLRPNGDVVRYNPATNEFGVKTRGGIIRTYFKPMAGRSYFDAQ